MKEGYTLVWSFRNRLEIFKESIQSAHNLTPLYVDFCLVDASSNDEVIRELRTFCNSMNGRKIRICESDYRSNLSEAWNLGMMLTSNRYVIFSSSDVVFKSTEWFTHMVDSRVRTNGEYILMENHAVFLIDKKSIPRLGWFDEEFIPGPHFDVDYMIRASENNITFVSIANNGYYTHSDTEEETIQRTTTDVGDRLPMNNLHNENYFISKWQSSWPGWKNHLNQVHKPHPPTNINQVRRQKLEIDPHPLYTKKFI